MMNTGYNLVEEKLIGKEYEKIEKRISIIEFLRKLRNREPVNRVIAVVGFEDLLLTGEETARYVRRILSESAPRLRNHVIQFPIKGELILDREPKIRIGRGREIRLTPIFGVRLKVRAPGYFHSPPNI